MPGRRSATANSNSRRTALPIRSLSSPAVVPAKAGTQDHPASGIWVPACAGTTGGGLKIGLSQVESGGGRRGAARRKGRPKLDLRDRALPNDYARACAGTPTLVSRLVNKG